jgi:hypothetical protein
LEEIESNYFESYKQGKISNKLLKMNIGDNPFKTQAERKIKSQTEKD